MKKVKNYTKSIKEKVVDFVKELKEEMVYFIITKSLSRYLKLLLYSVALGITVGTSTLVLMSALARGVMSKIF